MTFPSVSFHASLSLGCHLCLTAAAVQETGRFLNCKSSGMYHYHKEGVTKWQDKLFLHPSAAACGRISASVTFSVKATGGLEAALPRVVTELSISHGILLHTSWPKENLSSKRSKPLWMLGGTATNSLNIDRFLISKWWSSRLLPALDF